MVCLPLRSACLNIGGKHEYDNDIRQYNIPMLISTIRCRRVNIKTMHSKEGI